MPPRLRRWYLLLYCQRILIATWNKNINLKKAGLNSCCCTQRIKIGVSKVVLTLDCSTFRRSSTTSKMSRSRQVTTACGTSSQTKNVHASPRVGRYFRPSSDNRWPTSAVCHPVVICRNILKFDLAAFESRLRASTLFLSPATDTNDYADQWEREVLKALDLICPVQFNRRHLPRRHRLPLSSEAIASKRHRRHLVRRRKCRWSTRISSVLPPKRLAS